MRQNTNGKSAPSILSGGCRSVNEPKNTDLLVHYKNFSLPTKKKKKKGKMRVEQFKIEREIDVTHVTINDSSRPSSCTKKFSSVVGTGCRPTTTTAVH